MFIFGLKHFHLLRKSKGLIALSVLLCSGNLFAAPFAGTNRGEDPDTTWSADVDWTNGSTYVHWTAGTPVGGVALAANPYQLYMYTGASAAASGCTADTTGAAGTAVGTAVNTLYKQVTGIANGTKYFFKIKVTDVNGGTAMTGCSSDGITGDTVAPTAPTMRGEDLDSTWSNEIDGTPTQDYYLHWTVGSDSGSGLAAWYKIYEYTNASTCAADTTGASGTQVGLALSSLTAYEFEDHVTMGGSTFYYKIRAEDVAGNYSMSSCSDGISEQDMYTVSATSSNTGVSGQLKVDWTWTSEHSYTPNIVTVTRYASSNCTGTAVSQNSISNGIAVTSPGTATFTGGTENSTYSYIVVVMYNVHDDNSGASTCQTHVINNTDVTAPTAATIRGEDPDTTWSSDIDATSSTSTYVHWAAGSDGGSGLAATPYEVFKYVGSSAAASGCTGDTNGTSGTSLGTTSGLYIQATGLSNGSKYYFKVKTKDVALNYSMSSCTDGITIDSTAPTAATIRGEDSDTTWSADEDNIASSTYVHWAAGSDAGSGLAATPYQVYRYAGSTAAASGCTADTTGASGTSIGTTSSLYLQATSLTNGTKYFFKVKTFDAAGNYSMSSCTDGATVDSGAPTAATIRGEDPDTTWSSDIDATSSTSTYVHWAAGSDSGSGLAATPYQVYRYSGSSAAASGCTADTSGGSGTSLGTTSSLYLQATSLSNGTTYYFKVKTIDAVGNYSMSSCTDGITIDTGAPTAATIRGEDPDTTWTSDVDTSTTTSTYVHWAAGSDSGSGLASTPYEVFRYSGSTAAASGCTADTSGASGTSLGTTTNLYLQATSLTNGTIYYFKVKTFDAAGNYAMSSCTDGITIDTTAPTAATIRGEDPDTTWTADEDLITSTSTYVHWAAGSDSGSGLAATPYQVYRYTGSTAVASGCTADTSGASGTSLGTTTNLYLQATGLSSGSTYFFKVKTFDVAGNYTMSSCTDGVTVDTDPPTAPSNLKVTDSGCGESELILAAFANPNFARWDQDTSIVLCANSDAVSVDYEFEIVESTDNFTDTATTSVTSASGTGSITYVTPLSDGTTYKWQARTCDSVLNCSSWVQYPTYTFGSDQTDPTALSGFTIGEVLDDDGTTYYSKDLTISTSWTPGQDNQSQLRYDYLALFTTLAACQANTDANPKDTAVSEYVTGSGKASTAGTRDFVSGTTGEGPNSLLSETLTLSNGSTYYIHMGTIDNSGRSSGVGCVGPVKIDTTNPTGVPGNLTAGSTYSGNTSVTFTWDAGTCADANSGVQLHNYYVTIGTTNGGTDIFSGSQTAASKMVTCANGNTCYARVHCMDDAENYNSSLYSSSNIVVDTVAPTAPTIVDRADNLLAFTDEDADDDTGIKFYWDSGSDSGSGLAASNPYTLYIYDDLSPCVSDGSNIAGVVTPAVATSSTNGTYTGTMGRTYSAQVKITDKAGNEAFSACTDGILISGSETAVSIDSPDENSWINSSTAASFTISGSCESSYANDDVQVRLTNQAGTLLGTDTSCTGDAWSLSVNVSAVADSDFVIWAGQTNDLAAVISDTRTFRKDTDPPAAPSSIYERLDNTTGTDVDSTSNSTIYWHFTAGTDSGGLNESGLHGTDKYRLTYYTNGTCSAGATVQSWQDGSQLYKSITGLADGTYSATVTVQDAAGNTATSSCSDGITIGAAGPSLTSILRHTPSDQNVTAGTTTVKWIVTFDTTLNQATVSTADFEVSVVSGSFTNTGSSSMTVVPKAGAGSNDDEFYVTISGVAGTGELRLDFKNGGSVANLTAQTYTTQRNGDETYIFDQTAPSSITLRDLPYYVTNNTFTSYYTSSNVYSTSVTTNMTTKKKHQFEWTLSNPSNRPDHYVIQIDDGASPNWASLIYDSDAEATNVTDDGSASSFQFNGSATGSNMDDLSDGIYSARVVAYDSFGNTSTSNVIKFVVDTTAPTWASIGISGISLTGSGTAKLSWVRDGADTGMSSAGASDTRIKYMLYVATIAADSNMDDSLSPSEILAVDPNGTRINPSDIAQNPYALTGVSSTTKYVFVRAIDLMGNKQFNGTEDANLKVFKINPDGPLVGATLTDDTSADITSSLSTDRASITLEMKEMEGATANDKYLVYISKTSEDYPFAYCNGSTRQVIDESNGNAVITDRDLGEATFDTAIAAADIFWEDADIECSPSAAGGTQTPCVMAISATDGDLVDNGSTVSYRIPEGYFDHNPATTYYFSVRPAYFEDLLGDGDASDMCNYTISRSDLSTASSQELSVTVRDEKPVASDGSNSGKTLPPTYTLTYDVGGQVDYATFTVDFCLVDPNGSTEEIKIDTALNQIQYKHDNSGGWKNLSPSEVTAAFDMGGADNHILKNRNGTSKPGVVSASVCAGDNTKLVRTTWIIDDQVVSSDGAFTAATTPNLQFRFRVADYESDGSTLRFYSSSITTPVVFAATVNTSNAEGGGTGGLNGQGGFGCSSVAVMGYNPDDHDSTPPWGTLLVMLLPPLWIFARNRKREEFLGVCD